MSSSEKRKQKKKPTTYLRHRARPVLAISTRWLYVGSFSYSAGFHSRLPSSSQMVKGGAMLAGEEGGRAGEVRVGAERFLRSALSFSFRLPFATRAPCVLHCPAGGWMAQACTGMRGTSPRFRQSSFSQRAPGKCLGTHSFSHCHKLPRFVSEFHVASCKFGGAFSPVTPVARTLGVNTRRRGRI